MIDRYELKKRLIQDGYIEANGLDRTIDNLLHLPDKAAAMLEKWMKDGEKVEFDAIMGIDSSILREKLQMKEPAIILSYGMLLKDPKVNSVHLKNLMNRRKIFTVK